MISKTIVPLSKSICALVTLGLTKSGALLLTPICQACCSVQRQVLAAAMCKYTGEPSPPVVAESAIQTLFATLLAAMLYTTHPFHNASAFKLVSNEVLELEDKIGLALHLNSRGINPGSRLL